MSFVVMNTHYLTHANIPPLNIAKRYYFAALMWINEQWKTWGFQNPDGLQEARNQYG